MRARYFFLIYVCLLFCESATTKRVNTWTWARIRDWERENFNLWHFNNSLLITKRRHKICHVCCCCLLPYIENYNSPPIIHSLTSQIHTMCYFLHDLFPLSRSDLHKFFILALLTFFFNSHLKISTNWTFNGQQKCI